MRTVIQTAAAAANFNGTTTGVVDFSDLPLDDNEFEFPIIINIALEVISPLTLDFDCRLQRPGVASPTTQRITIVNVTGEAGFSKAGCEIPVPRVVVGASPVVFTPWVLRITTANKSAGLDCSLIVSYDVGRILRG